MSYVFPEDRSTTVCAAGSGGGRAGCCSKLAAATAPSAAGSESAVAADERLEHLIAGARWAGPGQAAVWGVACGCCCQPNCVRPAATAALRRHCVY